MKKIGLTLLAGASLLLLLHVATVARKQKVLQTKRKSSLGWTIPLYRWAFKMTKGTSLVSMLT